MTSVCCLVSGLPASVQRALKSTGYGRRDIGIDARESVAMAIGGGDGYRGFVVLVDLATGRAETHTGSWGGSNMFNRTNAVDLDNTDRAIHVGMAVIKGHQGGGRPVCATVYLHPANVAKLLPAKPTLSERHQSILATFGYISSYRKERQAELKVTTEELDELASLDLITRNRAGACQLTTAGKNARTR